jgi:hypothetical protein
MGVEIAPDPNLWELSTRFPVAPLEDIDCYRAALETLDRLSHPMTAPALAVIFTAMVPPLGVKVRLPRVS